MENRNAGAQKNRRFYHLMGMNLEDTVEFFARTLKRMGFEIEIAQDAIRAQQGDTFVCIYLRRVQNPSRYIRHIPRTEVIIEAPEEVHNAIRSHIMRSKAGG